MKPASVPEFLWTVEEAAARLRVVKNYVYRLCSEGRLAFVKLGDSDSTRGGRGRPGAIRIPDAALADFIKARTVPATAPPPEPVSPERAAADMERLSAGPHPVEMADEEDR